MKKNLIWFVAACPLLLAGCATEQAQRVDPQGTHLLTTVGQIHTQDFMEASEAMIASLKQSPVLANIANPPAILVISRIVNNTGSQIDTDLLVKKIRTDLSKDGRILTKTTMGLGGAEDPLAKGLQQEKEFLDDKKTTRSADFSLSGKIIETRTRVGDVRQSVFTFQLSLTDTRGLAVWEEEKEIAKQGKRPAVGF